MAVIDYIEKIELYSETKEIDDLVQGFKSHELPKDKWTHEAHLTVALWHLLHYPPDEAVKRIREGIQSYNLSKGVITTKTSGYHETITLLYIWAIRKFLSETCVEDSITELANELVKSHYADRKFLLEYYTKERLMSSEARFGWLEPDLKPLD